MITWKPTYRGKRRNKGLNEFGHRFTQQKILGASILETGGDEVISGILNVMYADVPYTFVRDSVIPHPIVSEMIPSMLEGLKEG